MLYFIIFISSYILTWILRNILVKKSIIDLPNERSSHITPTPRSGGIAIAITWFVGLFILFIFKNISYSLFFALLCGLPISAIGLLDDMNSISPKFRLIVQTISAIGAVLCLGGLNSVDLGFGYFSITIVLSIVAILGIVWFTNLFNFLDGIDGYVSTEIIYIGLASFFLFRAAPPLLLAATTAGFLVWNWQPAKIFMGDVASTLLGFNIGIFTIYYQNSGESSIIIWLMLTSVFWFDASLTLFRRWRNKETLSKPHKKHAYQRIVQYGFSHQKTTLHTLILNILIFLFVLLSYFHPYLLLPFLCLDIVLLYILVKSIDRKFPFR